VLREAKDKELKKYNEQKEKTKIQFFVSNGIVGVSNLVSEWELLQSQLFNASERVDATIRAVRSKWASFKLNGSDPECNLSDFESSDKYAVGCTKLIFSKDLRDGALELLSEAIKRNSMKPVSLLSGIYVTNKKTKKKECYPINVITVAVLTEEGGIFLGVTLEERAVVDYKMQTIPSRDDDDVTDIDSVGDTLKKSCKDFDVESEKKHLVCFWGKSIVYEKTIQLAKRRSKSRCSSVSQGEIYPPMIP